MKTSLLITLSTFILCVTARDHSMCLFMLFIKLIVLQHYPQCSLVFSFSPPRLQILVPVYQLHKCQALSIFGIFWRFPNIYKSWLTFLSQLIPSTQIIIYYIEIFWPRKIFSALIFVDLFDKNCLLLIVFADFCCKIDHFRKNLKFKSFIFSSYKIEILKSNFCHFSCKSDLNWILLNFVGIYMPAVLDLLEKTFKFCSKLASFFPNLNSNMNNSSRGANVMKQELQISTTMRSIEVYTSGKLSLMLW